MNLDSTRQTTCLFAGITILSCVPFSASQPQFHTTSVSEVDTKTTSDQARDLFHQIVGIMALDNLNSNFLSKDTYVSVDRLDAWLATPIEDTLEPDSILIACGKQTLAQLTDTDDKLADAQRASEVDPILVVNGEKQLQKTMYDPDSLKRLKAWCDLLVKHHPHAKKTERLLRENTSQDILSRCQAQQILKGKPLSAYQQHMYDSVLIKKPHQKMLLCKEIRRRIGSYCALKAAQQGQKRYPYLSPENTDIMRARGSAQQLYNDLAYETYQATCDDTVACCEHGNLPIVLQQKIELFLYDPYTLVKDLHSAKGISYPARPEYISFFVDNENITEFSYSLKKKLIRSALWGYASTRNPHVGLRYLMDKHCESTQPYRVRSIHTSSSNYCVESIINEKNIMLSSHLGISQDEEKISLATIIPLKDFVCWAPSGSMAIWWCEQTPNNYITQCHKGEWAIWTRSTPIRLDILASNDEGNVIVGLGKEDVPHTEAPFAYLYRATYNTTSSQFNPYHPKLLPYKLFNPVLVLSHSGKFGAVGGYDEFKNMILGTFLTDKALNKADFKYTSMRGTIKKLIFSRDDTQLFLAIEQEEDKKTAESYGVIDLRNKDFEYRPCTMPQPKDATIARLSAIDSHGEYIGVRLQEGDNIFCRIIPTEHHIHTHLIKAFKKLQFKDRHQLYLLHKTIGESPGYADISPQQWKIFKQLGLQEHLFLRPRLRLKTTDRTKILGAPLTKGEIPVRETTLSGYAALYAASQL